MKQLNITLLVYIFSLLAWILLHLILFKIQELCYFLLPELEVQPGIYEKIHFLRDILRPLRENYFSKIYLN